MTLYCDWFTLVRYVRRNVSTGLDLAKLMAPCSLAGQFHVGRHVATSVKQ